MLAMPMGAAAITQPQLDNIIDGGVTTISPGDLYSFGYIEQDATGGARSFIYEFNAPEITGSFTGVALNPLPLGGISGLFVQWLDATQSTVVASWDGVTDIFTTSFAAGETKYLSIGWDGSVQGGDVDVNIQAVPLPAGFLLLGTAMAGAFALRRKA